MLPKKQHHKTPSQEITTEALMNYLSTREALHARMSNSPTLKFNLKAKQAPHQQSPLMKQNSSSSNTKNVQQINLINHRPAQRKIQPQDVLKNKGFMSPKLASQERVNQKSHTKSRGQHIKTQPHSHQNSQSKVQPADRMAEDYFTSFKMPSKQFNNLQELQPQSATSKMEQMLKQKVEISNLEAKQKQSDDFIQRLNFQKSLGVSSAKNQPSNVQLQGVLAQMHQKSNSAQFIETQKFQTHSSSQPLISPEKAIINTTRKQQQDFITIVLFYKSFKQKITVDISVHKMQFLVDLVKQTLIKQFGTQLPQIIGIKTSNISIPVDYILSKIDRPLSLLSTCPNQPLIIEPIIQLEQDTKTSRICLKDFEFIRCIGMGGFSKVYLVRERRTGKFYAMKLIEKNPIIQQNKQSIIQSERDIMSTLQHPFLIDMQYAFESRKYLVFVLEYCSGGELFYLLRKVKRMSEQEAYFYFAEICLGMKYLHDQNIIYRDIKPENILIDFDGHVRIADFGLSKPNMQSQEVAYSFCGSPEYMAPEMLLKAGHTFQLDLYCLGALLYELVTGLPPFYSRNTDEIYQRIINSKLTFPPQLLMSPLIKDLLTGLLAKNPKRRIDKIDTLLKHPWMTQWGDKSLHKTLLMKEIHPPFKPDYYQFNFDEEEFGKGEAEFLQFIKQLQQNSTENMPKEIILKQFFYNKNPQSCQESTGGTNTQEQGTQRQKSKRVWTVDDENSEQKVFLINQLRLQTEHEGKRKSA